MNKAFKPLLATALLSMASLILEISFARVLSVILIQSYVFLVLSLAVLGIGLGSALVALFPSLQQKGGLSLSLQLASVSTLLLALLVWGEMGGAKLLLFLAATLPYLFLGMTLAALFSRNSAQSSVFYGVDLIGAGLGVLFAVPLLNGLGGFNSLFVAALVLALASLMIEPPSFFYRVFGLVIMILAGLQVTTSFIQMDMTRLVTPKPMLERLNKGGKIVETRWDAFSRTDLVYQEAQDAYYLYMDGGAGSVIPDKSRTNLWQRDIGQFPFVAEQPESSFIIGPGGGLDIALAKATDVAEIRVVEVNHASIDIVREMSNYAGELYGEAIKVFADEGRSVLKRSAQTYDLIFLSQVITQAADARAYVLAENKLYTVEAFHDYLDHLNIDGQIALKLYDELTLTRAFLTAIKTLSQKGMTEAEASKHLFALLDTQANPPIPLLIVKNQAIEREEAIRLARLAEAQGGYAFLFIPGLLANPPLDALASGQKGLDAIIANALPTDLRPVTDNRPFFYNFEKGLPSFLQRLILALLSLIALLVVIWIVNAKKLEPSAHALLPMVALLGLGFMALEIVVLQKTQLLLGHPTLALSLMLGVLLLGSGLGSLFSSYIKQLNGGLLVTLVTITVLWMLWTLCWFFMETALVSKTLTIRALLTALSLLPLAFCLGIPFPIILTKLGKLGSTYVALAWTVNGIFSVLGSVLATAISLSQGFSVLSLMVLVSYICIIILLTFTHQQTLKSL